MRVTGRSTRASEYSVGPRRSDHPLTTACGRASAPSREPLLCSRRDRRIALASLLKSAASTRRTSRPLRPDLRRPRSCCSSARSSSTTSRCAGCIDHPPLVALQEWLLWTASRSSGCCSSTPSSSSTSSSCWSPIVVGCATFVWIRFFRFPPLIAAYNQALRRERSLSQKRYRDARPRSSPAPADDPGRAAGSSRTALTPPRPAPAVEIVPLRSWPPPRTGRRPAARASPSRSSGAIRARASPSSPSGRAPSCRRTAPGRPLHRRERGGWVQVGDERAAVNHGEAVLWPAGIPHGAWTEGPTCAPSLIELPTCPAPRLVLEGVAAAVASRPSDRPGTVTPARVDWSAPSSARRTTTRPRASPGDAHSGDGGP